MRMFKRRNGYWYVREATGDTSLRTCDRREAERNLAFLLTERQREKAKIATVAEMHTAYLKSLEGQPSHKDVRSAWKQLGPALGALRTDALTETVVDAFCAAQEARGRADGTIWMYLNTMRRMLAYGLKKGLTDKISDIENDYRPGRREVWLTKQEANRLLGACEHHHLRLSVLLMMTTAQRYRAILDLRWKGVDWASGTLDFGTGYSNKRRATVPMNASLRAALSQAQEVAQTSHVVEWCGQRVNQIRGAFNTAKERAGLDHITPHDLRRSAARWMIEGGISMDEVSQLLGHTSTKVTAQVYARFSPTYLRRAVDVLEVAIAETGDGKKGTLRKRLVNADKR